MRRNNHVNKECKLCKRIMYDVDCRKRFCNDCITLRKREQNKCRKNKKTASKNKPDVPREEVQTSSLDAKIAAADRLGISYGRYVAMVHSQNKRKNRFNF